MTQTATTDLDYVTLEDPSIVPMDDAMDLAFDKLGLPRLGGASGKGWSRYRNFMVCPRKYELRYLKKADAETKSALAVGSAFHAFLAIYYENMRLIMAGEDEGPPPSALRDALLDVNAEADCIAEGWRIFDAYADHYEGIGDYIEPLAVEQYAQNPVTGDSCRYDLIARIGDIGKERGIAPGTYIIEHKSSSRLDRGTTEGWHLDGEVIGQLGLWKPARLARRFGKLKGVIVNIVTKSKVPKFHREIVAPPMKQVSRQMADLKVWDAQIKLAKATKTFPRNLSSCWGSKYGPCEYVDHCRDKP